MAPAAGGEGRAISFLANGGSNTVSWSPDGTFLLFDSGQRTETAQLARIDLIPRTPKFREDQFRDLFKEETPKTVTTNLKQPPPGEPQATPAATPLPSASPAAEPKAKPTPKPVEITFDQIRQRLTLLPVGIDVRYQTISPDGKWALMIASVMGRVHGTPELSRISPSTLL